MHHQKSHPLLPCNQPTVFVHVASSLLPPFLLLHVLLVCVCDFLKVITMIPTVSVAFKCVPIDFLGLADFLVRVLMFVCSFAMVVVSLAVVSCWLLIVMIVYQQGNNGMLQH